jgi:glycosyltransferase involved in cell wall biosynthesis
MPVLNRAKSIRRAIESVFAQNYEDWELLVIDGGSTDGTLEIIKSYGSKIRLWSEKDRGTSDAMNKGMDLAQGDLVTYLNSDDFFYHSRVLERAVEEFRSTPEMDILCASVMTIDPDSGLEHRVISSSPERMFWDISVNLSGTFFRREILLKKHFDLSFKICNDHDLLMHLMWREGANIRAIQDINVGFGLGGFCNDVRQAFVIDRERFRVRKRYQGLLFALPFYLRDTAISILRRMKIRPFFWMRKIKAKRNPSYQGAGFSNRASSALNPVRTPAGPRDSTPSAEKSV